MSEQGERSGDERERAAVSGAGAPNAPAASALWRAGGFAALLATALNLAIWGVGRAAGVDYRVVQPDGALLTVDAGQVASQTIIAVLAGTLLLWPMTHLRAGVVVWLVVAVLVGLGSLFLPFSRAVHASTALTLAPMHLVALACALLLPGRVAYRALQRAGAVGNSATAPIDSSDGSAGTE